MTISILVQTKSFRFDKVTGNNISLDSFGLTTKGQIMSRKKPNWLKNGQQSNVRSICDSIGKGESDTSSIYMILMLLTDLFACPSDKRWRNSCGLLVTLWQELVYYINSCKRTTCCFCTLDFVLSKNYITGSLGISFWTEPGWPILPVARVFAKLTGCQHTYRTDMRAVSLPHKQVYLPFKRRFLVNSAKSRFVNYKTPPELVPPVYIPAED